MSLEVTDDMLKDILSKDGITILDFYAEWCGPCKMYGPILDEFSKENPNVMVGKVNVDTNNEFALQYGIRNIPTTIIFKDGELMKKIPGVIQKNKLRDLVEHLT